MIPVVTPEEMAAIDAATPEPVEVLIGRAGSAVARAAVEMLGGTYGRRVVVVAGRGNNGNDGRDAAQRLTRRGVRVQVIPASEAPRDLPPADLVIDAAYGTGFHGEYQAPHPTALADRHRSVPQVLAVDIPSGVSGLTGKASGTPLVANRTVSFAALKPGLVLHPGRELAGEVTVADIGLDVSSATAGLVEEADVTRWVPRRDINDHKWSSGLLVVAGSPGMLGAGSLVTAAAQRAGAGMVRYLVPGAQPGLGDRMPTEAVAVPPDTGPGGSEPWPETVATLSAPPGRQIRALVIGPGLGRAEGTLDGVRQVLAGPARDLPVVVDADALTALGDDAAGILQGRVVPAVLTPHDGEHARLTGARPGPDRCAAARELAEQTGSVVLLKGSTTVVAHPVGRARFVTTGDQRLATAGTGDVLSGVIGAFLARGADPFNAAAAAAWVHGRAASHGPETGLIASDLLPALPQVLSQLAGW